MNKNKIDIHIVHFRKGEFWKDPGILLFLNYCDTIKIQYCINIQV